MFLSDGYAQTNFSSKLGKIDKGRKFNIDKDVRSLFVVFFCFEVELNNTRIRDVRILYKTVKIQQLPWFIKASCEQTFATYLHSGSAELYKM